MTGQTILIGGTSHTGKSTLAEALSEALGWPVVSTDSLARHPGRPWPAPKPHVAEIYTKVSTQTLVTLLHHHHQNMAPILHQMAAQGSVILEGNAVRPEFWPHSVPQGLVRICLWATESELRRRILTAQPAPQQRDAIRLREAFLARCIEDQRHLKNAAQEHGWVSANLSNSTSYQDLIKWCKQAANSR